MDECVGDWGKKSSDLLVPIGELFLIKRVGKGRSGFCALFYE